MDSQELPPFLLDLLEQLTVDLFYQGCIITEIRDFRRRSSSSSSSSSSTNNKLAPETSHVLLRPSNLSIICDSYNLSLAASSSSSKSGGGSSNHSLMGVQNGSPGSSNQGAGSSSKGGVASDTERTGLEAELLLQTQVRTGELRILNLVVLGF